MVVVVLVVAVGILPAAVPSRTLYKKPSKLVEIKLTMHPRMPQQQLIRVRMTLGVEIHATKTVPDLDAKAGVSNSNPRYSLNI